MIKRYSDHAANERTFLAWVRTAIAVMAFGFVIERFDLFLQVMAPQLSQRQLSAHSQMFANVAGLAFIAIGVAMIVLAGVRFLKTSKNIESEEDVPSAGERLDLALAVLIGLARRRAVSLSVARRAPGDLRAPAARTSSVTTLKLAIVQGPNEVTMATSVASRPRAIRMRPMRGVLWRASNVYQRSPRKTSNQAEKSIGARIGRHADVAEITGAVARRDVHAAAQRDREVGEVAADAAPLGMRIPGGLGRAGMLVAEFDAIMDVIADRLHQRPALRNLPEQRPRLVSISGRSRNSGCRADRSEHSPAGLQAHAAPPAARSSSGSPLSRIRKSADIVRRPAGARITWQKLPKMS